jgi:hypothetical protein
VKIDSKIDAKIIDFFFPVTSQRNQDHENMNNDHDNEVTLEPNVPEEELEDNLLQENPGATVDFKLIINDVCIRSTIEKWRKTSKYVEEIHKQEYV